MYRDPTEKQVLVGYGMELIWYGNSRVLLSPKYSEAPRSRSPQTAKQFFRALGCRV